MTPFNDHSRAAAIDRLMDRLEGGDLALVSDAGTPGISDPGYPLVREALARGYPVVPIPGASAVISALVGSGLPSHAFRFVGFLPRKTTARRRLFEEQRESDDTLIAFEAPHRLNASLADLAQVLPQRPSVVAREISKKFEEFVRGSATDVLAHFQRHSPRGEITLLVAGRSLEPKPDA
jgi:16S rRNA (cytidine1402-2'-O)-methyltransferase